MRLSDSAAFRYGPARLSFQRRQRSRFALMEAFGIYFESEGALPFAYICQQEVCLLIDIAIWIPGSHPSRRYLRHSCPSIERTQSLDRIRHTGKVRIASCEDRTTSPSCTSPIEKVGRCDLPNYPELKWRTGPQPSDCSSSHSP